MITIAGRGSREILRTEKTTEIPGLSQNRTELSLICKIQRISLLRFTFLSLFSPLNQIINAPMP